MTDGRVLMSDLQLTPHALRYHYLRVGVSVTNVIVVDFISLAPLRGLSTSEEKYLKQEV